MPRKLTIRDGLEFDDGDEFGTMYIYCDDGYAYLSNEEMLKVQKWLNDHVAEIQRMSLPPVETQPLTHATNT